MLVKSVFIMACSYNVSRWIATASLLFQMLLIVERQVFDFLGRLWSCTIANFVEAIFIIVGIYGVVQNQWIPVLLYVFISLFWFGWNTFLICFYNGVGVLGNGSHALNMGKGGNSWWIENGLGCPNYHSNPSFERASESCVELIQSAFQLLWTPVCIVLSIMSMNVRNETQPERPPIEDELVCFHTKRQNTGDLNKSFASLPNNERCEDGNYGDRRSRDRLLLGNESTAGTGAALSSRSGRYPQGRKRSSSGPINLQPLEAMRHNPLMIHHRSLRNVSSSYDHQSNDSITDASSGRARSRFLGDIRYDDLPTYYDRARESRHFCFPGSQPSVVNNSLFSYPNILYPTNTSRLRGYVPTPYPSPRDFSDSSYISDALSTPTPTFRGRVEPRRTYMDRSVPDAGYGERAVNIQQSPVTVVSDCSFQFTSPIPESPIRNNFRNSNRRITSYVDENPETPARDIGHLSGSQDSPTRTVHNTENHELQHSRLEAQSDSRDIHSGQQRNSPEQDQHHSTFHATFV